MKSILLLLAILAVCGCEIDARPTPPVQPLPKGVTVVTPPPAADEVAPPASVVIMPKPKPDPNRVVKTDITVRAKILSLNNHILHKGQTLKDLEHFLKDTGNNVGVRFVVKKTEFCINLNLSVPMIATVTDATEFPVRVTITFYPNKASDDDIATYYYQDDKVGTDSLSYGLASELYEYGYEIEMRKPNG